MQFIAMMIILSSLTFQHPHRSIFSSRSQLSPITVRPSGLSQWQSPSTSLVKCLQFTATACKTLLLKFVQFVKFSSRSRGFACITGIRIRSVNQSPELCRFRETMLVLSYVRMTKAFGVTLPAMRAMLMCFVVLKYSLMS